jgi:hypothetical protein
MGLDDLVSIVPGDQGLPSVWPNSPVFPPSAVMVYARSAVAKTPETAAVTAYPRAGTASRIRRNLGQLPG